VQSYGLFRIHQFFLQEIFRLSLHLQLKNRILFIFQLPTS